MTPTRPNAQRGSGLIEALISMLVTTVVILGLAGLVLQGVRLQQVSRNSTTATLVAMAELERLRILPSSDPQRAVGGSLTADVANHFSTPEPGFVARWVVAAGPVGSQQLTLRVVRTNLNARPAQVQVLLTP